MRMYLFNLSRGFNWLRWALFVMVVSFVSVVGVYDYIDLSDSIAITFSVFETVFLLISDQASISYIFLPIYLFIVCGLSTQSSFGALEVMRYKSRSHWMTHRWLTLLSYTILFFTVLFALIYTIASKAFPFQQVWSTDFILFQVYLGQAVSNFVHPPWVTIGMSLVSSFFLYLFCGAIAMVCAIKTGSEAVSLVISLGVGIVVSLLTTLVLFAQNSLVAKSTQCLLFLVLVLVVALYSHRLMATLDFSSRKKG